MSANDNYFQKLIDLKLETISKMMSNEPNKKRSGTRTTTTTRRFNNDRFKPTTNNVFRRSLVMDGSSSHPDGYISRTTRNRYTSMSDDFNFLPNSHSREPLTNKNSKLRKLGETNDAENNRPEEIANKSSCSVTGLFNLDAKCSSDDPEFRADIISKLKSKAIENLLFKAREDMNVKRLNEMKTRPEKVAENALLMCDLKSYGKFVDELFSSGVFPVFKDKSIYLGNDKKVNYEVKNYATGRDMENLERMAERVFGDGFVHRSNYYNSFLNVRN